MAEQILHGSNVVTAAGARPSRTSGGGCAVWRASMPACSTARLKARAKGLVIHVMATHDTAPWIGRMRKSCAKTQNHGQECPARGYFRSRASGSATLRPSAWSFSHHARARDSCSRRLRQAPGNIKARSLSPCPPHDDRAVIEIQILTRSCKPSLIRMPVPYRSWANKRCSPSRKPRMRTTSSGVSTTGKRRDGRGLPIS